MNNIEFIEEYKKFISFEKRLSPLSIKSYIRDINDLIKLNKNKELSSYKISVKCPKSILLGRKRQTVI